MFIALPHVCTGSWSPFRRRLSSGPPGAHPPPSEKPCAHGQQVDASLMLPEQLEGQRPRYWCTEPFLGYFDGHTSDEERPWTSDKSSGLKVTKVARCTRA